MNTILFDGPEQKSLLPFTFTRPVGEIRIGILTLRQKWELALDRKTSIQTAAYLSEKWPSHPDDKNLFINPAFLPSTALIDQIHTLKEGEAVTVDDQPIAFIGPKRYNPERDREFKPIPVIERPIHIRHPWEIFTRNGEALQRDYAYLTQNNTSAPLHPSVFTQNKDAIFVEDSAQIRHASLNAENGPIYIGKHSEIMEGCHIRGPFALGSNAVLKLGAKIYGPTTIGPYCKIGGEVKNSVVFGYSNKGHDGYLGNSVLGEWCNIGADSNNSNLKNTYSEVKLWNYPTEDYQPIGQQFCGLMMGDHSKCGINTMFNTGTMVGVNANILTTGFPPKFIPSFTWESAKNRSPYRLEKALDVARNAKKLAGFTLSEPDRRILRHVFSSTKKYRQG